MGVPLDGSLDEWVFQDQVRSDRLLVRLEEERMAKIAQVSVQPKCKEKAQALESQVSFC